MDESPEYTYFTFPVTFLKRAFININQVCSDAIIYCLFVQAHKQNDTPFKNMQSACRKLNLRSDVELMEWFDAGQKLFNEVPLNTPKVSLKDDLIFEFMDKPKTEYEIVVFLAFAAFKSILGRNDYAKTNNDLLLARMAGCEKPITNLPYPLSNYNNRYQLDKIKGELRNNWKLKIYGKNMHGFYISFKMNLQNLIKVAETKRKKYKDFQNKYEQYEAEKLVLKELYG